jgi:hypothetical protein
MTILSRASGADLVGGLVFFGKEYRVRARHLDGEEPESWRLAFTAFGQRAGEAVVLLRAAYTEALYQAQFVGRVGLAGRRVKVRGYLMPDVGLKIALIDRGVA